MPSLVRKKADSESALASLAVLNVNWHSHAKSHLDSFVPFATEAVRRSGVADVTDAEAAELVRQFFGISLPIEVVGAVLKRAVRAGFGSKVDGGKFVLSTQKRIENVSLQADHAALLREQNDLELALCSYARERFNLIWTPSESSNALLAYVEDASARMVAASAEGAVPSETFASSEPQRIVVSAFINTIWRSQPQRFEYLMNVAKGSFLATTLFFQNNFDEGRKFKRTTIYLDSGIVIAALGFEGVEKQDAANEWIELARSQGASIACFDRTMREVRGILQGALDKVKTGKAWQGRPGGVASTFHENGYTPGVISALIASIENRLAKLHIDVHSVPAPSTRPDLQVDEDEVEAILNQGEFPYASDNALRHDSRVLGAIRIIRNGSAQDRFEDSRAVFVTGNYRVIRAARKVMDLRNEAWPVAMHVNDVAVLLWIKDAGTTSDLPRKQILAMCLSILRPSEPTWSAYIGEIRALQSQGSIGDVDIALIAQRHETDAAAIIGEIDNSGKVTLKSPLEVLAEAQAIASSPAEAATREAVAALEKATDRENKLHERVATLELRQRSTLARRATLITVGAGILAVGGLSGLTYWLVNAFSDESGALLAGISFVLQVALLGLPIPREPIMSRLRNSLYRHWLRNAGLSIEGEPGHRAI